MSQTVRPDVASFVHLVRGHLSDLTPEEVDELTGGLEADLDERIAETLPGSAPADLGDPGVYAAELRAAAGLPPRGAGGGRRAAGRVKRAVHWFWGGVDETRESVTAMLDKQPWWPEFRASVVALRPVWWVARGYVAWWIVAALVGSTQGPLPGGFGWLVLLLAIVGMSVASGRGLLDAPLRLHGDRQRRVVTGLNVLAVLALPFVLAGIATPRYEYVSSDPMDPSLAGLTLNGEEVRNIYAYDVQGRPVGVVQLYDQNGRPLNVAHIPYSDAFGQQQYTDANGGLVAPFVDDRSRNRWNVFPLPTASYPEPLFGEDGNPTATASPVAGLPPAPLVAVPPVTSVLGIPNGATIASGVPTPSASGPSASGPSAVGPSAVQPTAGPSTGAGSTGAVSSPASAAPSPAPTPAPTPAGSASATAPGSPSGS